MFCPYCGKEIIEGANFCHLCGKQISQINKIEDSSSNSTVQKDKEEIAPVKNIPKEVKKETISEIPKTFFGCLGYLWFFILRISIICVVLYLFNIFILNPRPKKTTSVISAKKITADRSKLINNNPSNPITEKNQEKQTKVASDRSNKDVSDKSAVTAYASEVVKHILEYQSLLGIFNELNQQVANRPSLIYDGDWKLKSAVAVVGLQKAGQELGNIPDVPHKLAIVDQLLKRIDQETQLLVKNYSRGVDKVDAAYINYATDSMNKITAYARKVTVEIEKVNSL